MLGYQRRRRLQQALEQSSRRGIQARHIATLQARLNVLGQKLAEFYAPLVKAVDAPDGPADQDKAG